MLLPSWLFCFRSFFTFTAFNLPEPLNAYFTTGFPAKNNQGAYIADILAFCKPLNVLCIFFIPAALGGASKQNLFFLFCCFLCHSYHIKTNNVIYLKLCLALKQI